MLKGKIKEVIKENGYGLIEAEDGREISFRTPSINEVDFKSLKEGDTVEFDVKGELHRCRFKAINVRIALG
jgi:cold shock CspA family protein